MPGKRKPGLNGENIMRTPFEWVLTLFAIGCLIGLIAGWIGKSTRQPRVRLFNKPTKARLSVLVPPGPAPRLIPSDSPKVTRARPHHAPVPAPPASEKHYGGIDYIAVFAGSAKASEPGPVDYLLESPDDAGDA